MKRLPPADFLAKMRSLLSPGEYDAFVAAYDAPPVAGLRVNTLKTAPAEFTTLAPFSLTPLGDWEPAAFTVTDGSRPGRHPYHDAGLYYLQDPSAMTAAVALAPAPGELVLDLAAAPGGKATHLAARMGTAAAGDGSPLRRALDDDSLLVANDVHAGRARLLAENLARWGAVNVLVTHDEPARLAAALGPVFDRVLIAAPCSGEAMFRRLESVEWSESIVAACARRQRGVLAVAPDLARPGGRLLYATCAFSPEENELVVGAFLAGQGDFQLMEPPSIAGADRGRADWTGQEAAPAMAAQLARAVRLWPHRFPGEGHFLALMARDEPTDDGQKTSGDNGRFRAHPPTAAQARLWRAFATDALALALPEERLHVHGERLYLLPRRAIDPGRLHLIRYGLLLGELRAGHFRPAHDLALALNDADARAVRWPADDPRLAAYLSGRDLPASDLPPGPDGWTLIAVDGFGLGWGKRAGGRLKNHTPHALRRA